MTLILAVRWQTAEGVGEAEVVGHGRKVPPVTGSRHNLEAMAFKEETGVQVHMYLP
jgi:hypothetical protein